MPKPLRVAIYARQSVKVDDGIERQLEACRALAVFRGWEIVGEYPDNRTSASRERGAGTKWADMLADYDAGKFDAVLCVAIDRLLRSVVDIVKLRAPARPRGDVRIMTERDGIDTGSPLGKVILTILVALAEGEIESKRARVLPARAERHARGVPTPGKVPYGYRWISDAERKRMGNDDARYAVVPEEAAVVRYVFREAVTTAGEPNGVALGSIARALNTGAALGKDGESLGERSRTTREGVPWRISTIRRMLLSPYYAGLLPPISSVANRPKNAEGKPVSWRAQDIPIGDCILGNWEPIIEAPEGSTPVDVLRTVRDSLTKDERRKHDGNTSRKWLLPGIARCGKVTAETPGGQVEVCGAEVDSAVSREGHRAYKCPRGHFSRRAEALDAWAVETLLERLSRPDATALLRPAPNVNIPALTTRESALEGERAEWFARALSGSLKPAEWDAISAKLDAQLEEVRTALAAAYKADSLAEIITAADVRAHWGGLSLAAQRAVLRALFEPIIYPVGKGWRVVADGAAGRQLNVADTVRAAWRRTTVQDGAQGIQLVPGLTDRARGVLASS